MAEKIVSKIQSQPPNRELVEVQLAERGTFNPAMFSALAFGVRPYSATSNTTPQHVSSFSTSQIGLMVYAALFFAVCVAAVNSARKKSKLPREEEPKISHTPRSAEDKDYDDAYRQEIYRARRNEAAHNKHDHGNQGGDSLA